MRKLVHWSSALCLVSLLLLAWSQPTRAGRHRRRRSGKRRQDKTRHKLTPPAGEGPIYVLKPLASLSSTKVGVSALDQVLSDQMQRLAGLRVLDTRKAAQALGKSRMSLLHLCGAEASCAQEFGRAVGAQFVVTGDVAPVGRSQALSLKVVSVASGKVVRRVSAVVPVHVKPENPSLEAMMVRLLAPKKYQGVLVVRVDVKGAKILVDGSVAATAPAGPIRLKAGAHAVRVTHPSYHDFVRFVRIPFKTTVTIQVGLKAYPMLNASLGSKKKVVTVVTGKKTKVIYRPLPWYRRWWVVTAAAVGAALLVGGVTATAVALTGGSGMGEDGRTKVEPDGRF